MLILAPEPEPKFFLVDVDDLKLLLRQCHHCGHSIAHGSINFHTKGGVLFAKFWCSKCNRRRYWNSCSKNPFVEMVTAAALLAGIRYEFISKFFLFLDCAFPSMRSVYYAAQYVVRPMIINFYEAHQKNIISNLKNSGNDLHLCMDGQYDSPGYCAHHCTVTAIESTTKKVVGFYTVKKTQTNNNSPSMEPLAFRHVLDDLISKDLKIVSVTTDNSTALNKLFATQYPAVRHYLDLWHITRRK